MSFFNEFKEFALKGNVLDMAVGVIIGGAFGKIVTSVVGDMLMPTLGLIMGGINFSHLKVTLRPEAIDALGQRVPEVALAYGNFIQAALDFLIIAFCVFVMVKMINRLKRPTIETATPPSETILLTEIRDILKQTPVRETVKSR